MAEKLGISQAAYSDLENGKIKITEEKLKQIANILEVEETAIRNFNDTLILNSGLHSGCYWYSNNNIQPNEKIQELYEVLIKEKDA